MELNKTETILHLHIEGDSKYWLKFVSASVLQTPDGKTYAITGGKATREGETDYTPDSLYHTNKETNQGEIALHFEPLSAKVRSFDFRYRRLVRTKIC